MEPKQKLNKKQQEKIVKKTHTNSLLKNVGFPKSMDGVTLNEKTGKYE